MVFLRKHAFVIMIICINSIINAGAVSEDNDLTVFTSDQCREIIKKSDFRSKEELLQIFYSAYFGGIIKNKKMLKDDINKLASSIQTIFPLKSCTYIAVFDSTLQFSFDAPQDFIIPGTYKMARLQISQTITFALSVSDKDSSVLDFRIIDGYLRIHYSKMAKLFNESFTDLNGTKLFYTINLKAKSSMLGLIDERNVSRKNLQINKDSSAVYIDILTPEFNEKSDIIASHNKLKAFFINIRLSGNDSIQINKNKWYRDSISSLQIKNVITDILDGFEKKELFENGITVSKTAIYELEKRRLSISIHFKKTS